MVGVTIALGLDPLGVENMPTLLYYVIIVAVVVGIVLSLIELPSGRCFFRSLLSML